MWNSVNALKITVLKLKRFLLKKKKKKKYQITYQMQTTVQLQLVLSEMICNLFNGSQLAKMKKSIPDMSLP